MVACLCFLVVGGLVVGMVSTCLEGRIIKDVGVIHSFGSMGWF